MLTLVKLVLIIAWHIIFYYSLWILASNCKIPFTYDIHGQISNYYLIQNIVRKFLQSLQYLIQSSNRRYAILLAFCCYHFFKGYFRQYVKQFDRVLVEIKEKSRLESPAAGDFDEWSSFQNSLRIIQTCGMLASFDLHFMLFFRAPSTLTQGVAKVVPVCYWMCLYLHLQILGKFNSKFM